EVRVLKQRLGHELAARVDRPAGGHELPERGGDGVVRDLVDDRGRHALRGQRGVVADLPRAAQSAYEGGAGRGRRGVQQATQRRVGDAVWVVEVAGDVDLGRAAWLERV